MSPFWALHAIAAARGDGLHPLLLEALRQQEANALHELPFVPISGLFPVDQGVMKDVEAERETSASLPVAVAVQVPGFGWK